MGDNAICLFDIGPGGCVSPGQAGGFCLGFHIINCSSRGISKYEFQ